MKYWKGKTGTNKFGQCGTMDDDGHVPDGFECEEADYDAYIASLPTHPPVEPKVLKLKKKKRAR